MEEKRPELLQIFQELYGAYGPRHWWPAESPWEMMVGAVLTQNVAWRNVVQAIGNLKEAGLLSPQGIWEAPQELLEEKIRPTRYYRGKARKLKSLSSLVMERYGGQLPSMWRASWPELRKELLSVYGIGEETADSILLYAGNFPVFVVDAYTRRIFNRLGMLPDKVSYREIQQFFMNVLPPDPSLFNEYHAQIDHLGHRVCLASRPRCLDCPLRGRCPEGKEGIDTRGL